MKKNVALDYKVFLPFTKFSNLIHNTDYLLYYPQMPVFYFRNFFVLLYQFLSNRT